MKANDIGARVAGTVTAKVYLVHKDEELRDALSLLFRSRGMSINSFASGEELIAALDDDAAGFVILDTCVGDTRGAVIFDHLRDRACHLPVILLTEYGDASMVVGALKKKAFDFVEMPFDANELVDRVLHGFAQIGTNAAPEQRCSVMRRIDQL